jgi:UPF0755 protein
MTGWMGPDRRMPRRARSDPREEERQWPPAGEETPPELQGRPSGYGYPDGRAAGYPYQPDAPADPASSPPQRYGHAAGPGYAGQEAPRGAGHGYPPDGYPPGGYPAAGRETFGAGPGYAPRQGHGYEQAGYGPGQRAGGAAYGRDGYPGGSTPGYAGDDAGYASGYQGRADAGYAGSGAPGYAGDDPRRSPGRRRGYTGDDSRGYPGDAPYSGTGDQRPRGPRRQGSGPPQPDDARYRDGGPYPGQEAYPGQGPYRGQDRYADDVSYPEGQDNPGRAGDDGSPPWEDGAYEEAARRAVEATRARMRDDERLVPGFGEAAGSAGPAGGSPGRGGSSGRGSKRRRSRWIAPLVAVLVIVLPLAVGGFYAFRFIQGKFFPADYSGDGSGQVVVQVQSGQTATSLGQTLVTLGVVASARAFVLAAEHSANQTGLEPGFYRLRTHMKASLAYALLLNPASRDEIKITIPEGWRLSQISADLDKRSGISAADFQKALNDPAALGLPSYADGKPEGYLFPATYEIQPKMTATAVLQAMVQRFDQEAASINLTKAAATAQMTPAQVITMASLIQAEGGSVSYYPQIARVIYNRLNQGMPLQLDSTVMYGLHTFGIIASDQQLQSTSPYNTYRYKGLPPGPIDSPGNAAIEAVLHPAPGNDLYFVTVDPKTGLTKFTASQAQFEQFKAELEQNIGQG